MLDECGDAASRRRTSSSRGCARSAATAESSPTTRRSPVLGELRARGIDARDLLQLGLGSRRGDRGGRASPARSTSSCRRRGSAPASRTRASTTRMLDQLGVAAGDALFVGDTWTCDVEGPRAAGLRAALLAAHRTSASTRPRPTTTTPKPCTAPPTSARSWISRSDASASDRRGSSETHVQIGSIDAAVVAGPVGRAEVSLQHLHRARQRERLGADLHRLRHLVAGDRLAGVGDDLGLGGGVRPRAARRSRAPPRPTTSSGMPITATCATSGCDAIAFSTSTEYTFSPPVTIMSFTRSTRNRYPCSSR